MRREEERRGEEKKGRRGGRAEDEGRSGRERRVVERVREVRRRVDEREQ